MAGESREEFERDRFGTAGPLEDKVNNGPNYPPTHAGGDTDASSNNGEQNSADSDGLDLRGGHGSQIEQVWRECASDGAPIGAPPSNIGRHPIDEIGTAYYTRGIAVTAADSHQFNKVMDLVVPQMHYAVQKHGVVTRDHVRRHTVAGEELGEVAEMALKLTSPDPKEKNGSPAEMRSQLRHEWAQLAAYSMLVLMEMEREENVVNR